jgi:hypothetical protein
MDYKGQTNMRVKKTMKKEKEKVRCVFCNSLSHKMEKCNSNFNGRRDSLDKGWCFLMDGGRPNFEHLAVNELRYVAYRYAAYEGAIHDWNEKTTQQYNRKFKFRPIDLTLSKTQLVKELVRRWEIFQPVRELIKNKPEPTKEDECPICLECDTTTYDWSPNISNWVKKMRISSPNVSTPFVKGVGNLGLKRATINIIIGIMVNIR